MVRDPTIVSPSLAGVLIGGGHNKHGTGSRCTLPRQCRPPSPRRRWRCDRSSYKRSLFSRIQDSLTHCLRRSPYHVPKLAHHTTCCVCAGCEDKLQAVKAPAPLSSFSHPFLCFLSSSFWSCMQAPQRCGREGGPSPKGPFFSLLVYLC